MATTAIAAGSAPFSGSFRPETPLSAFSGDAVGGAWAFTVGDDVSSGSTGTIVSTTLIVTTNLCVDPDGDIVYSAIDNCPDVANVGQENYAPDTHGDACDADDDNDGYDDTADACPQGTVGVGTDFDRDGCRDTEDPDDDDTVADAADACPQAAIGPGGDADGDGCKDFEDSDDDDDGDGDGDEADAAPLDAKPADQAGVTGPTTAPAITLLKLAPVRFAAARSGASIAKKKRPKVGTTLSYTTDQASDTTLTIARVRKGVRKGLRASSARRAPRASAARG